MDKKRLSGITRKLVLVIALAVFCCSAWQLASIFLEYRQGTEEYDELEELVFAELPSAPSVRMKQTEQKADTAVSESDAALESQTAEAESQQTQMSYVDFATLKAMNSDAVAWITMYGTNINYPVVQGTDNDYYLHHTFTGNENAAGAIFIDASMEEGMESKNVIVYGHNMKNGSMFGTLSYYKNEQMVKNYPAFLVYTESGVYEYAIFSAFMTTAGSDTYVYGFGSEESFMSYIDKMKQRSWYDTGVEVTAEDTIMTLSTCSGGEDERFVVQAKRVEPAVTQ